MSLRRIGIDSRKAKLFTGVPPDTYGLQVHPSTYFRIAQQQSSVLFPSLRRLHFTLGDSSCLKLINVYRVIDYDDEPEVLFTPSMTMIASKWSQCLKSLVIESSTARRHAISKCLMLLTDLHEMQTFHLKDWRMEDMDDDVSRLVMLWPKLVTLKLLTIKHIFPCRLWG